MTIIETLKSLQKRIRDIAARIAVIAEEEAKEKADV